jgi:hypothetical protein
MKKVIIAVVAAIVLSLALAGPVLADPPQGKVDKAVCPVIGGPNNPSIKGTPALVSVPSNNPAIGTETLPGNIFWPR